MAAENINEQYWLDIDLFLISMCLAALGGTVGYFQKTKALKHDISYYKLFVSITGAVFSGILVFLLTQLFSVWQGIGAGRELLTLVAVGIVGHFNNDNIDIIKVTIKTAFYSILKARYPSIDLEEIEKNSKKKGNR